LDTAKWLKYSAKVHIVGGAMTISREGLKSTTTTTGLYAVTGYLDQAFPNLNMASDAVDLEFSAPGFQNQAQSNLCRRAWHRGQGCYHDALWRGAQLILAVFPSIVSPGFPKPA
jgi:hypothetical protein